MEEKLATTEEEPMRTLHRILADPLKMRLLMSTAKTALIS